MENAKVHVWMVTYNHERFIAQALESYLSQVTNFQTHLFIGDDCSKDQTPAIVKEYAAKYPDRITALINEKNLGIVRNSAWVFSHCTAPYVALLEGDDYWNDPKKLQKQVDFLENNPEYGMVHADVDLRYEESGTILKAYNASSNIHFPSGNILTDILLNTSLFIKTATLLARRDLFIPSFHPDLILEKGWLQGDLTWCLEMAHKTKIKYMDEVFATYRLLGESASRTNDHWKKYQMHKSGFDIRIYFAEKFGVEPAIQTLIFQNAFHTYLHDAYLLRDWKLVQTSLELAKSKNLKIRMKDRIKILVTFMTRSSKNKSA